jgi:alpha-beta hydrolase superfamily lysophospholipase
MFSTLGKVFAAAAIAAAAGGSVVSTADAAAPKRFILVHGAWHTADAWDGVIAALKKQGYSAEAITLPGNGVGDASTATLAEDAAALTTLLKSQSEPVALVAHSAGGVVVQQALPVAADKVSEVIFLDAFLVPNGKRLLDTLPPDIAQAYEKMAAANHNTLPVPTDLVRHLLMPDESTEEQDRVIRHLVTEPYGYYTGTVDAAAFAAVPVKHGLLLATQDKSLPDGAYRGMVAAFGPFDEVDIPGGHEVLFTDPDAVADGLVKLISKAQQ